MKRLYTKQSNKFKIIKEISSNKSKRTKIMCLVKNCFPKTVKIKAKDEIYLKGLNESEFNASCCLEFGAGLYGRKSKV